MTWISTHSKLVYSILCNFNLPFNTHMKEKKQIQRKISAKNYAKHVAQQIFATKFKKSHL